MQLSVDVRRAAIPVLVSLAVGLAIVALVGLDYAATRQELLALLREQAATVRETLAAAARSNQAASAVAATQLRERLLESARFLRELEAQRPLRQADLDRLTTRSGLFRVAVFSAAGERQLSAGGGPGGGPGPGGGGPGWRGGGHVVEQLVAGAQDEVVTDIHAARGRPGDRLAAGVRRPGGGAIVVTVDASAVADLQRSASLHALLEDVTRHAPDVAYTVLESDGQRVAHGELPAQPWPAAGPDGRAERELRVAGRPVLELLAPVPLGEGPAASLRLGLRLDGLQRAERRLRTRLAASLLALALLLTLAFGVTVLRRRYGALSERHARAQEALRRRDRLAAMGEMAASVAHEVRNPLNAIAMSAQRLRREWDAAGAGGESEREERRELLDVLVAETRRIDAKVQQFLDFARPPVLQLGPVALGEWAGALVEARRPLAESREVSLEADLAQAGQAQVDAEQLRQALDNVLRNAIEATPAGGRVRVTARSLAREHVLEVSDTGPGIPPEALPRLFDLYFTTKPEGTGVGLAVTQQVVAAHGGSVEVDSAPGQGARFSLRLPRAAGDGHA